MEQKEIRMKIRSVRYDVEASFFSLMSEEEADGALFAEIALQEGEGNPFDEEEKIEINTIGVWSDNGKRIEISYEESEASGMEGSRTAICFEKNEEGLVSMIRTGAVSTALVFEQGKRHHCVYNTPIMPFELCVRTLTVENHLMGGGCLLLDYVIELRGAKAERTKFELTIL